MLGIIEKLFAHPRETLKPQETLEPESKCLTYQDMIDFWGSRYKCDEELAKAALLNSRPAVPWDWQEAIDNYFVATRGLAWAVANCPVKLTPEQLYIILERMQGRGYGVLGIGGG